MKKKSLLVFLLAMASTATMGAVGCKDDTSPNTEHEHSWSVHSNADLHWQECDCGDTKEYGVHVDELNNETSAHEPDGKCDVCGASVPLETYEIKSDGDKHWKEFADGTTADVGGHLDFINNQSGEDGKDGLCDVCGEHLKETVTFIVSGNGTAPAVQSVNYGGHAEEPEAPKAQGLVFAGWYEDDRFETEFNFEEKVITGATLVYAKWEEDTTPGMNAKYAKAMVLQSESVKLAFGEYNKLYFKFTAEADGRYELMLLSGTSSKCTFTTDFDTDGASYNVSNKKYFDLDAGETIVVEVTRGEGVGDNDEVGVYVSETINEPLSEDWHEGVYTDGSYVVTINGASIDFKATNVDETVSYNYVGGKVNTLTFTAGSKKYVMQVLENDLYSLTADGKPVAVLSYSDAQNVIPVSKFAGIYAPVEGGTKVKNITELVIYETGDGYYLANGYKYEQVIGRAASYLQSINTLRYDGGDISMTLDMDEDGEVTGVVISYLYNGTLTKVVYEKTADAPDVAPELLPLDLYEYAGHTYSIKANSSYYHYWNGTSYLVKVDGYVKATDTYTITANGVTYKVKIENVGTEDEPELAVHLFDEDGENELDVLTKYAPTAEAELPNSATATNVTLALTDMQKGAYYYTVTESGWYKFTADETVDEATGKSMASWLSLKKVKTMPTSYNGGTGFTADDSAVWLDEDEVVCVVLSAGENRPSQIKFTVTNVGVAGAPAGADESKPLVLDGTGNHSVSLVQCVTNYVEINLPVGDYLLSVSNGSVEYSVDGGEVTKGADVFVSFTVTDANTPVKVVVSPYNTSFDTLNFSVLVEEDYTASTKLAFDEDGKGTLTAGAYYYADITDDYYYFNGLVLGSDDGEEFTLVRNGVEYKASKFTLTSAQLTHGFKVVLGEGMDSVECAINFSEGAVQNPVVLDKAGNQVLNLGNEVTYVKVTADKDTDCVLTVTHSSAAGTVVFEYDGHVYNEGDMLTVAKGTTVTVELYNSDESVSVCTVNLLLGYDFTEAEELVFEEGVPSEDEGVSKVVTVNVEKGVDKYLYLSDSLEADIKVMAFAPFEIVNFDTTVYKVTGVNGVYNAVIEAGHNFYIKLSSEHDASVMFVMSYGMGSFGNPYEVELSNGSYSSVALSSGSTSFFHFNAEGTYKANNSVATYDKSQYDFVTVSAGEYFTAEAGDLIRYYNSTKNAKLTLTLVVPEDYQGSYKTEDGTAVSVDESVVTVDGKNYTLTSVSNGVYTFKAASGESVTFTFGENPTYNNKALEVVYMFTEDMAQTYSGHLNDEWGWFDYEATLTLYRSGKGTFKAGTLINSSINVTENKGTYTFTYIRGADNVDTATFTFGSKGEIYISLSSLFNDTTFTPEHEFEYNPVSNEPVVANFPVGADQTYTGIGKFMGSMDVDVTLTLNEDGTGEMKWLVQERTINVMVLDGVYSFDLDGNEATFTFGDNGVISIETSNLGNFNLTPETSFDPTVFYMFAAEQTGTYTGVAGIFGSNTDIFFTLNRDGTGRIKFDNAMFSVDDQLTFTEEDGKYSFVYNKGYSDGYFTFNNDGTLVLTGANFSATMTLPAPVLFTEAQAGAYKAAATQNFLGSAFPVEITLTFDVYGVGVFTYNFNGNGAVSHDIEISKDGDKFTFNWDGGFETETFTINEDGTLSVTSTKANAYTLSPDSAVSELTAGTYMGQTVHNVTDEQIIVSLTVNSDLTGVYNDGESKYNVTLELSDGKYVATYSSYGDTITVTVNADGTLSVVDDYVGSFTLSTDFTAPEAPDMGDLEPGAYRATVTDPEDGTEVVITLFIDTDFTGVYSEGNLDTNISLSYNNGVYSFEDYYGDTVYFNLNADGTLTVTEESYYGEFTLSPTAK